MGKWKERLLNQSLENKLIFAFSAFIVLPFLLIGGIVSYVYVDNSRNTMMDAAVDSNKQIMTNIDTSMQPLLRLSMFPIQELTVYQIMRKDYKTLEHPMLEQGRDFDIVNNLIRNGMMLYSDLIESVIIYHENSHFVFGRSNREYINADYAKNHFIKEPYVQRIRDKQGTYVAVGIHSDHLLSRPGLPVVSIGRAIIDPYTKEDLGFILLNISVDKLKTLWSDTKMTENTKFYLVDELDNVIYSTDRAEIGKPATQALGEQIQITAGAERKTWENKDTYMIASSSEVTGWKAVTVIPKGEMLSIVYKMIIVMAVSLIMMLFLSIIISVRISTTIMKPLSVLKGKMKLVSQGKMDVSFEPQYGEIGMISHTVDTMLKEIRGLIDRIYREEEEKRKLEMIALQSQIQPHFIYNTLNVIKWMAKIQGASGIEEAVSAFSSVIKFTVKAEGNYVTIADEISFIRNYTNILDFRYMGKFEVEYDMDESVSSYKTLKFLLQPLVENAVFHGFDGVDYKGKLTISIKEADNQIVMTVADNGRGFSAEENRQRKDLTSDPFNSIGIENVRNRIRLHFGDQSGLWITSKEGGGTTATIRVPIIK